VKRNFIRQLLPVATMLGTSVLWTTLASGLEIGAPAPPFLLPATDGKSYSLENFSEAKVFVVVFTCNHCPTSQAYEDRLISISRDFTARGVAFVAISPNDPLAFRRDELGYSAVDDTFGGMKIRAARKGFPFPYLYDGDEQTVSRAYAPRVTPHVFLFDQDRRLRYSGRIDNAVDKRKVHLQDLRSAIEHVLDGKKIRIPETKVLGCPVKWSEQRKLAAKDLARLNRESASLKGLDDDTFSFLLANKSKLLKLFFVWSPRHIDKDKEFARLVEIHRRYRKRGLDIITITAQNSVDEESVLMFLQRENASFRNYFREGSPDTLFQKLDARVDGSLPFVMLVEPNGRVTYRHAGSLDSLELKRSILQVLGRRFSP